MPTFDSSVLTGQDVIDFITDLERHGGIIPPRAQSMRSAVKQTLRSVLGPRWLDQPFDVRDVDRIIQRFRDSPDDRYSPSTVQVYASRFQSVIEQIAEIRTFRSGQPAQQLPSGLPVKELLVETSELLQDEQRRMRAIERELDRDSRDITRQMVTYPFPLRPNVLLRLGLPTDLTRAEADRIAEFVRALAVDHQVDERR